MNELDTLPWYRQFWPWFLIALPATAVVASLYTVSLAYRTTDSLVTNETGGMDVVSERHIAAERAASALGLDASLEIDSTSGAINVLLNSDAPQDWPQTLELLMSHPTAASRDQVLELTAAIPDEYGNPVWNGHFVSIPDGRWYVVLTPPGGAWRLSGTWTGEETIRLHPAGDSPDESP